MHNTHHPNSPQLDTYREAVQTAVAVVVVGKFDLAAELLSAFHPL